MTLVGVCDDCGYTDGGHAPTCPRWKTMSEYERLKAQKDAILAKEKARGDALMEQPKGTLMAKLKETEAERDKLQEQVIAVEVVLATWRDDQGPIMSLEVKELISEIEKALAHSDHANLIHEATVDIMRETKAERDALASVVTRQRSEIDTLRAENEFLRSHASQRTLDALNGPKVCPVCNGDGGDWEDSSMPCYECGR